MEVHKLNINITDLRRIRASLDSHMKHLSAMMNSSMLTEENQDIIRDEYRHIAHLSARVSSEILFNTGGTL